jgi:hypothetical protein
MPNTILMEELHVTVVAPVGLRKADYQPMLRTLRSKRFHANLRDAVRQLFRRHSSLMKTQFSINR